MAPPERICLQYKDECDCAFDAGFRRARRPRGLKARRFKEGLIAALKRCATQKQQPHQSCGTQKQQVSPLRSRSLASVEMTGGWSLAVGRASLVVRRWSLAGQREVSPLRSRALASVEMTGGGRSLRLR
jgi:hypothetical protein